MAVTIVIIFFSLIEVLPFLRNLKRKAISWLCRINCWNRVFKYGTSQVWIWELAEHFIRTVKIFSYTDILYNDKGRPLIYSIRSPHRLIAHGVEKIKENMVFYLKNKRSRCDVVTSKIDVCNGNSHAFILIVNNKLQTVRTYYANKIT